MIAMFAMIKLSNMKIFLAIISLTVAKSSQNFSAFYMQAPNIKGLLNEEPANETSRLAILFSLKIWYIRQCWNTFSLENSNSCDVKKLFLSRSLLLTGVTESKQNWRRSLTGSSEGINKLAYWLKTILPLLRGMYIPYSQGSALWCNLIGWKREKISDITLTNSYYRLNIKFIHTKRMCVMV